MKFIVGEPVERDDGRHYIPLMRDVQIEGVSRVALRVASDAFETLDEAVMFAKLVALIWAKGTELPQNGVGDPVLMHSLEQADDYAREAKQLGPLVEDKRMLALSLLLPVLQLVEPHLQEDDIGLTLMHLDEVEKEKPFKHLGEAQIALNVFAIGTIPASVAAARHALLDAPPSILAAWNKWSKM